MEEKKSQRGEEKSELQQRGNGPEIRRQSWRPSRYETNMHIYTTIGNYTIKIISCV